MYKTKWGSQTKGVMNISDMHDEHIKNVINMLIRRPITRRYGTIGWGDVNEFYYEEEEDTDETNLYIMSFERELMNRRISRLEDRVSQLEGS